MSDHYKWQLTFPTALLAQAVVDGRVRFVPPAFPRIPVILDRSMPRNCFELRSGDRRLRVCWVDETTELDRWSDDGGATP